jgi:hypothetical protein
MIDLTSIELVENSQGIRGRLPTGEAGIVAGRNNHGPPFEILMQELKYGGRLGY